MTGMVGVPSPNTVPTACEKAREWADTLDLPPDPLTKVPSTSKIINVKPFIVIIGVVTSTVAVEVVVAVLWMATVCSLSE